MARPTIHKDGTPLTPTERQQRWRLRKREAKIERAHEHAAILELEAIERRRLAVLAEQIRITDDQIRITHPRGR